MKKTYAILLSIFALATIHAQENKFDLIVGTFTKNCESKGIYVYEFDANTGDFRLKNNTENILNPSYLTVSSDNKFVYSVSENDKKSTASAFKFDSKSGKIDFINSEFSKGQNGCYIINDEKNIITANYSSGSISVFGKKSDGSIAEVKQVVQHIGKSINKKDKMHLMLIWFIFRQTRNMFWLMI